MGRAGGARRAGAGACPGFGTAPSRPNGRGQRPPRPTARQLRTLRFERTEDVTRRAYQAVAHLASSRRLRRLSDPRKQTAAEMLELRTIIRISDLNVAPLERDAMREQAAKAELRSWIRGAFGVDLEKVNLTRRGLVRR